MSTLSPAGLCIIADDLTGALDAAAPFAGRGLDVEVALSPEALPEALAEALGRGAPVLAVTTASREIPAHRARAALARTRALLPPQARVFKKIDSRMKGHVEAELSALAPRHLLVAPAIPDFGRLVQDGHVTGFGVDQPIPVAGALGAFAPLATIPDTASAQDMLAALDAAPADALLVGAKGLAEALAIRLSGQQGARPARPVARAALAAIGSTDPITLAQVQALRAAGGVDWRGAPLGRLPGSARGPLGALTLVQAMPGDQPASGEEVAAALTASLHPGLTMQADLLFLTGGATAEAVLSAMGLRHMNLVGEVFPGVPLARRGALSIITKSGGFGGPDLLADLAALLRGPSDV
ncbi:four-carbon acid sugar kinase family protein [Pseudogemmobacter sonorensis]|uniref:four-carbon acid sugar kinase family protein n=1 Tax=Pseudogemmobacter sonorensis TaxID=2989681 RepID=UPI0036A924ED